MGLTHGLTTRLDILNACSDTDDQLVEERLRPFGQLSLDYHAPDQPHNVYQAWSPRYLFHKNGSRGLIGIFTCSRVPENY